MLHFREKIIFERQGITQKFASNLDQVTMDPLASLRVPGIRKFFDALAHFQPVVLSKYPNFTATMLTLLDDSDISLKMISIETPSFIAIERDGKLDVTHVPPAQVWRRTC